MYQSTKGACAFDYRAEQSDAFPSTLSYFFTSDDCSFNQVVMCNLSDGKEMV